MFGLEIQQLVGIGMVLAVCVLYAPVGLAKVKALIPAPKVVPEDETWELVDWFGMVADLQSRLEDLGYQEKAQGLNDLYPLLRHPAKTSFDVEGGPV